MQAAMNTKNIKKLFKDNGLLGSCRATRKDIIKIIGFWTCIIQSKN